MEDTIVRDVFDGIEMGDVEKVRRLFAKHPEVIPERYLGGTWLHFAAGYNNIEMLKFLLQSGFDVNARGIKRPDGPLSMAIGHAGLPVIAFLLEQGADPNIGRLLIGAINRESDRFETVRLLVEHGVDVNRCYHLGDDDGPLFNALSWAIDAEEPEIADYLRAHGAVLPEEQPSASPTDLAGEIVAYFEREFGKANKRTIVEIVPSEPPIAVHVIPASESSPYVTLFTTGMSARAMRTPPDENEYRFAELFFQLPADWPLEAKSLKDPNWNWPIKWLRSIAKYPHQQYTWLGGPVTIIAKDPSKPFAPKVKFTCMLLTAERQCRTSGGMTVQLYRLIPLYAEERSLEIREGLPALMHALDRHNISRIVTLDRPNVATA